MSAEALRSALGRAFDPEPPAAELPHYHRPFDELTGETLERDLLEALRGRARIAVVGPSGCGKTSPTRFIADADTSGLAPIYLNVAQEEHELVPTPRSGDWMTTSRCASALLAAATCSRSACWASTAMTR